MRQDLIDEHDYYAAMTRGSRAERAFHPRRVELVRSMTPLRGKRVLDIGCSTGPIVIPLLQDGVDVVGVDLSAEHLERLRAYAAELGLEADVRQADAARLPFEDDSFDVVLVASVVHLVPQPQPLLREAERVCKRDGRIVVAGPWSKHPKSNVLLKTILRGGKPPDGRKYPFSVTHLTRWMTRSTLVDRKTDYVMGYLASVWDTRQEAGLNRPGDPRKAFSPAPPPSRR